MNFDEPDLPEEDLGSKGKPSKEESFFDKLLSFFVGAGDPDREKRKLLKQIGKDLKKTRYKFFTTSGDQALPGMGKFFSEIYKVVGPAQLLLQGSDVSNELKNIVIEYHLEPDQLESQRLFSEDHLRQRSSEVDTKRLGEEAKDAMINYFSAFDSVKVREINQIYNLILGFIRFTQFDFYFVLKKFDSSIRERDFNYNPRFESINGEYISDDIKDFFETLGPITRNQEWDKVFDILKVYRSVDVVARSAWKKLVGLIEDVRRSRILELIVQYIDKDPYLVMKTNTYSERIVEAYLNKFKTQTELVIQKIINEKRNQKQDKLVDLVFGSAVVARMKNYNEKTNLMFSKKTMAGFLYMSAMNYTKAFLLDYVKKDMRDLRDILIVRGKWTTNIVSQQLSEPFHQLMSVSENLLTFDDNCAEEGEYGQRIKKVITRVDKDALAMKSLRDTVKDINEKALAMINETGQNLVVFGKTLKTCIDDFEKSPHHEVILNWKELDVSSDGKLKDKMITIYKRIFYFIQLLQMLMKSDPSAGNQTPG